MESWFWNTLEVHSPHHLHSYDYHMTFFVLSRHQLNCIQGPCILCSVLAVYVFSLIHNSYQKIFDMVMKRTVFFSIVWWSPDLTALGVWPSVVGHLKGVLYWGGHNLVNFLSLAPPLRLYVCTYLALSNWHFGLCVHILYSFCSRPPNPTTSMLLAHFGFGLSHLACELPIYSVFFLKF